ncbi:MAG: SMC-Scp complex subunit ScpB [Myxococcota bacterium]|nr:SMC-Scp complex subunit ScpB [Myxococcota bacterium]
MSDSNGAAPVLLAVIEALLFVSDRPVTAQEICNALQNEELDLEAVEASLKLLEERHGAGTDEGRGFQLRKSGEGWQFRTAEEVTPWLTDFTGLRPVRLSRAALETLAIVAYRQPCTRAEIERVRGVNCGGVVRALLDRGLLRLSGRRNEPGRPNVYATTREFLDTFGLTDLQEMPNLREFTMLGEEDMEAVSALFEDPDAQNQVTMEEFASRKSLLDSPEPTPGLEPIPGEAAVEEEAPMEEGEVAPAEAVSPEQQPDEAPRRPEATAPVGGGA